MIKVTVYHNPLKRGSRSAHSRPWCVTTTNGQRSNTERFKTQEEAIDYKARIMEYNS